MNKQMLLSIFLAVALVVSMTINIILWSKLPENDKPRTTTELAEISSVTTVLTVLKEDASTVSSSLMTESENVTVIDTPYGIVKFPAIFHDVSYQSLDQDGIYTLTFFYDREFESVELFSIHFGDKEQGTLIGYVNKEGKDVPFTVTSANALTDAEWSFEEQEYFNTLLMAVNDVIDSVFAWDNFIE